MSFTEIEPFVTDEERQYLLSRIDEENWFQHKSTVSGLLSPLQLKSIEYRGVSATLLKMDPNTTQDFHTDGVVLKRNTVIIHPLTDNYAPFSIEQISPTQLLDQSAKPIIANTQARHAVFNNNNTRLNLQIPFNVDYNDSIQDNSEVWNLLNRFYKENNE